MSSLYGVPEPLPPLQPDDPAHAEPSDHKGVLVCPLLASQHEVRSKGTTIIRRFPKSKLNTFGKIIGNESWSFLCPTLRPTHLVDLFQYYLKAITDTVFPEEVIKIQPDDKHYFTQDLKI